METMVPEPYVYMVPKMMGGFGGPGVGRFYGEHFISQIPKDAKVTPVGPVFPVGAGGAFWIRRTLFRKARQ
ncbi:MAG: hypothetical protein DMG13_24790 [Acidobacteria bacterium]|nr:MAG: hypothetical protein DMG13_24790 [Acidobacteriota bacterium]